MLRTRILVAIVALPILVWLIVLPVLWPLFAFILAGLLVAMAEFGRMVRHRNIPFRWEIVLPAILLFSGTAFFSRQLPGVWPINAFAVFWLLGITTLLVLGLRELLGGFSESLTFAILSGSLLAVIFLGGVGVFLILLRLMPHGSEWLIFLFGFNWLYDAGALFSGKYFGKKLLAPTISPAKTVEGLVGGLLVNAVAAVILFFTWTPRNLGFTLPTFVLLGITLGLLSQAGDLMESMFKRWSGCKDASHIIPGHGGVLDKIDNLCFTAPLLFGVAYWLSQS